MIVEGNRPSSPGKVLNTRDNTIGGFIKKTLGRKLLSKTKSYRRIATCYDKLVATYLGFSFIASMISLVLD